MAFVAPERWFLASLLALTVMAYRASGSGRSSVPPEVCAWVRRLRATSLKYVAETPEQATRLARQLVPARYPNASLVCGPLTAAVLADMDLLPPHLVPRFWLFHPQTHRHLTQMAFPSSRFLRYDFATPVGRFDFSRFPLIPGDVVFLYAGKRYHGFAHMLLVTHTTPWGQAYGLSNVYTPQGFVIREILLYDLTYPEKGYFVWWNDPRKKHLTGGWTGTAGFTVWRLKWLAPYAPLLARGACAFPLDRREGHFARDPRGIAGAFLR